MLLNGEPVAGPIAASAIAGWVEVIVGFSDLRNPENERRTGRARLRGKVEIVADPY